MSAWVPFLCQGRQVRAAKSIKAGRQAAKFLQFQGRTVLFGGRQALCMALRLGAGGALRQAGSKVEQPGHRGLNSIKHAGLKNEAPRHVASMALLQLQVYVVLTKIILIVEQILQTSLLGRDSWLRGNYDNIE